MTSLQARKVVPTFHGITLGHEPTNSSSNRVSRRGDEAVVGTVQYLGPVRTEVSALGVRWGALFILHASAHNPPED